MPDTLAIQIADAIASEINGHTWLEQPSAFTAVRQYLAVYEGTDLDTLRVAVAPTEQADINATREKLQSDFTIVIDVQKRLVTPPYTTEMDALVNLLAEMKEFFDEYDGRLPSPLDAFWVETVELAEGMLWDPMGLHAEHAFEAAIRLVVRGIH